MKFGDTQTCTLTRKPGFSYLKAIENEWLEYMGFKEKEIDSGEIDLVVKADYSKKHEQSFVGLGRKFEK